MDEPQDRELEVFSAARHLPGAQRPDYLAAACAGDATLRQRVEELLQANQEAGAFLKDPAPGAERPTEGALPDGGPANHHGAAPVEQAGDRIGRYRLLQQIGEGGCGVVYMAEQEEPVRRRVALKVIKLGMDTKNVIARFEAERQALALMDHPNIAKVLDAGATAAGRPFFVMELVRGIKVTDYCDQNHLSTTERLGLFVQICRAIQHAHQKGIIHRDIKPSNILVTMHDGLPVPKVIDFGIAKATDQRLTDKTLFTAYEQFIGTPAYMSPEQAEMSALDIDTRSDIYSLGVLLYELLTGKTPFDNTQLLQAGLDEMRRTIREQEPVRPSTRLSTMLDAELTRVAKQRHSEPARLSGLLRGDLDWVVMKSLEKDRTRRYETANGLAMDIKRFLDHEPVVARPPSKLYRLQKLARRNRAACAAAGAVLAALLLGLGISTYLFVQEKRANERARTETRKSQQVARFLQDMLQGVGPSVLLGRDPVMFMLANSEEQVGRNLRGQPDVAAELLRIIGRIYYDLGDYDRAEKVQSEALRLNREFLGEVSTNTAIALHALGLTLQDRGDLGKAETRFNEALDVWKQMPRPDDARVAEAVNDLGLVRWTRSDLAGAEPLFRRALEMRKKMPGDNPRELAESFNNLGLTMYDRGELAEAERMHNQTLELRRQLAKEEPMELAGSLNNLGLVLQDRAEFAGAERSYREALALVTSLVPGHPRAARVRNHLGVVLRRRGAVSADPALLREAVRMNPADPLTADSLACAIAKPSLTPVLTGSDSAKSWRYQLTEPRANWSAPDFAETNWPAAPVLAGYATYSPRTDRAMLRQTNLWLRREFELTEVPAGKLVLLISRDHDAQVFLNGIRAAPAVDWSDADVLVPCTEAGRAALKRGRNVLAMHCQDSDGGAPIQAGLYVTPDPSLGRRQLIEEFDQMIQVETNRAELYSGRANLLARLGRWREAASDLNRAIEIRPSAAIQWYQLAPLLLEMGDLPGYRLRRQVALDQFAKPGTPAVAEQVAKLSLLLAAEGPQLEAAMKLADTAAAAAYADKGLAGRQFTKGLAEYRQGRFASAIEWMGRSLATGSLQDRPGWSHERERNRSAAAHFVQAMAHHKLNETAQARTLLARGNEIMQAQCPLVDSGDVGREWPDWLIAHILWREASNARR